MLLILYKDRYDTFSELKNCGNLIFITLMIACIVISFVSLFMLIKSEGYKQLEITNVERPNDTIISYMMTYIIPILTADYINDGEIMINLILFLLIGYLYVRLNLLYLNPLWSMFGYMSYRANTNTIIITNIDYTNLKHFENHQAGLKGYYLANDIFVSQKRQNTT